MRGLFTQIICCCLFASSALAQNNTESGSQSIINFSQKEFNANGQTLAIMQDKRGIMYFGNGSGLLEFDGANWRLYKVPNKSTVNSLAYGNNGEIFAGAVGDLGYFLPDSTGGLKFHSLFNFLPEDKRGFSTIWEVCVKDSKVYFRSDKYIFIWDTQKKLFKIIQGAHNFHGMFMVNGEFFIREWEKGLEVLQGDSLVLLKGGEKFASERIYVMLPFPGEKETSLIVTRTMGLFKYDGNQFIPFKTEADKFIKDNVIYRPGAILPDGNILLGTLNGGAVVISSSGKEIRRYNTDNGIFNNSINYVFHDRSGSIWLVTDDGISRIDYSSPLSYFDRRNNLSTSVGDIIRYNGAIYVAAGNGVYCLEPGNSSFKLLKNSSNQSWSFAKIGNELLVGTNDGLFKVEKDSLSPIRKSIGREYNANVVLQSQSNPKRIYVAAQSGLYSILKSDNKWIDEGRILENEDQKTSIIEDSSGRLWMGTFSSGLFRITFQKDKNGNLVLNNTLTEHFDKKNGLADGLLTVYKWNTINYFVTADSIYKFDERKKIFYTDSSDEIISAFYKITDNKGLNSITQDSLGRIWIEIKGKLTMGTLQPSGSWQWVSAPFNKFADENVAAVYAEKNGTIWFGTGSGMIKYDFGRKNLDNSNYAGLVRRVDIGNDSTIYFGDEPGNTAVPEISFKNNSIKFNYSATSYEDKNSNQFKTILEGFDKGWSSLSRETVKEYTNLPPGKFVFKVSALNISGYMSSTGSYSFEILPPWYRTWWAYSLFIMAFVLVALAVGRWLRHRVIAKEREQSEFREATLRAEAENEQRKNIELISEMGKDITSSLSIEHIIETVYAHVNKLMDASVFGIGIFNRERQRLEFPATKEKGETLPAYSYYLDDKKRPASWSFNNKKEIFMNDFEKEHQAYISDIPEATEGQNPESIIYLPLIYKEKSIGVITAQSFSRNAYNDNHLNILRSLATYTAVALDNADTYRSLKSTQAQLMQSEKMASLGELTAGIAHEIQNPLNFINNFSEVNKELIEEMRSELKSGNNDEAIVISNNIKENEEKINHHGKRADAIVKGMLQHSRSSAGQKELTDINALVDEYLKLAYHGVRAKDNSFNATLKTDFDESAGKSYIIPQEIGRVLLNLYNNAFYAVNERQKMEGEKYEPIVSVTTKKAGNQVSITVSDNGRGIPQKIVDKIFQPFFTTKPTGTGTGLGLSLSYDIVKAHGGEIKVETKEAEGTMFIIQLPII